MPVRTLSERPPPPRPPALSRSRPPPGPLSLWLSLFLPKDDGGDPITAMLLETREHGGTRAPEWSRCERHPVPHAADAIVVRDSDAGKPTGGSRGSDARDDSRDANDSKPDGAQSVVKSSPAPPSTRSEATGIMAVRDSHDADAPATGGSVRDENNTGGSRGNDSRGASDDARDSSRDSSGSTPSTRGAIIAVTSPFSSSSSSPLPPTTNSRRGEIVICVDGLRPRTYYSFRASAVNAQGAGDPGPACRRVRTSAPRPPTWAVGVPNADTLADEDSKVNSEAAGNQGERGSRRTALLLPPPPRAACSGLGACTVGWDEPFSNGAPIDSYEVETVKFASQEIAVEKRGSALKSGSSINSGREEAITTPGAAAAAGEGRPASPQHTTCEGKPDAKQGADPRSSSSSTMALAGVVTLPGVGVAAERRAAREIEQRFTRSVPAHLRHAVIRGLVTGSEYAFRVVAINSAGRGQPGSWTGTVRVADPADLVD